MLTELEGVTTKWEELGLALNLSMSKIREIEANNPKSVRKCLKEVIVFWVQSNTEATWTMLCDALRSSLVNCSSVAQEIEKKLKIAS